MSREQMLYDVPQEWRDNLKVGHCWCGKPRSEFDPRQKIYCSEEHSIEFSKRVKYWSSFKEDFLNKVGRICSECGITEEKFKVLEVDREKEYHIEQAKKHSDAIEFERARMLIELDKQYKNIFDDSYVMAEMHWSTKDSFNIDRYERFERRHFQIDVDHKIAVSLGGQMWDEDNLQPLCNDCHKKKTKNDMYKLKHKRKSNGISRLDEQKEASS